jgi:predicted AAA+ superfamily ATPase
MNQVFANRSEEYEIYPLTVKEIVEAQKAESKLKLFFA